MALLEDGSVLERPTVLELAERLGVTEPAGALRPRHRRRRARPVSRPPSTARPRACAPCSWSARRPAGQAGQSSRIENYLGFPTGLVGLRPRQARHRPGSPARRRAAHDPGGRGARAEGAGRIVELDGGRALSANCVLVATGVSYRQLDAPGFEALTGAGIYYGAALTEAKLVQRSARRGHRRRELRGAGGGLLQLVREVGHHARAQRPGEVDVALSDRADRRPAERRGPRGQPRDGGTTATATSTRSRSSAGGRGEHRRRMRASCSSAPHRARTGSTAWCARRARLHPRRPRRRRRRVAAGPRALPARDERPRRLRGRRRARAVDEAGRERRRAKARWSCRSCTSTWSTHERRSPSTTCARSTSSTTSRDALAAVAGVADAADGGAGGRSSPRRGRRGMGCSCCSGRRPQPCTCAATAEGPAAPAARRPGWAPSRRSPASSPRADGRRDRLPPRDRRARRLPAPARSRSRVLRQRDAGGRAGDEPHRRRASRSASIWPRSGTMAAGLAHELNNPAAAARAPPRS